MFIKCKKYWLILVIFGLGLITLAYCLYMPQKYYLSVAAIMKNEKPYLKEWIEYHLLQGVEHFYLCDNDSTDGTKEYLAPYIQKGIITYIEMSGADKQLVCYSQIAQQYKNDTTWLALIDLDEFLVPLKAKNMPQFLKEFDDAAQVSLYWMNYGDNYAFNRQQGLVTEFFTAHGYALNHTVKSIIRPEKVIDFNDKWSNHWVKVAGKSVNENHQPVSYMLGFNISGHKARVNHYIIKSFAEFLFKRSRGHPDQSQVDYRYYFFHNQNDVLHDTSMERFLPELKKRMKNSPLADVPLPQIEGLPTGFEQFYFSPEEVSAILGTDITTPMSYDEVKSRYYNRHPQYNKK